MKRKQSQVIRHSQNPFDKNGNWRTGPKDRFGKVEVTKERCLMCNDQLRTHEVFYGSNYCASCKLQLTIMSNVIAFRCDYCGQIHQEADIVGINPIEDMFDRNKSYPTVMSPEKTLIHYCMPCYRTHVIDVATNSVNRKQDERAYTLQLSVVGYNFRKATVKKYLQKKDHNKRKV